MSGRAFFRKGIAVFSAVCLLSGARAQEPIRGCTDFRARNYRSEATVNDGSCVYARSVVKPYTTLDVPPAVSSTSGLLFSNGSLYTHNDHKDRKLYQLDTVDVHVLAEISLPAMAHRDVEDITSDSAYIYLGDFGNNSSGNRTDLHILRLLKSSLQDSFPVMDTLWFSYPDQHDFTPVTANHTDFDCEAMIAVGDSLYLFTKQWTRHGTTLYALPKTPGRHVADSLATYAVDGLITSAAYDEAKKRVVLCGYSSLLQPFLLLLYDYPERHFFSGNKRKVQLDLPFHQVEAVEHYKGNSYFLSNETFRFAGNVIPAQLHKFSLSEYFPDSME